MFDDGYLVHIIPTFNCNLKCPYCYTNSEASAAQSTNQNYLEMVAEFVNSVKVSAIHLEGGEPFLFTKLYELIDLIDKKEKIHIVTNGYMVRDDNLKALIERGIKKYIVSIDYMEQSEDKTKKSCCSCLEVFNRNGIIPEVSVTLSKSNYMEYEHFLNLFKEYQIAGIRFGDIVRVGYAEGMEDEILENKDYEWIIPRILDIKNPQIRLSLHGHTFDKCDEKFKICYDKYATKRYCDMNVNKITILPQGDIYTCFNLINNHNLKVGNIYHDDILSIEEKIKNRFSVCKECPVGIGYHIGF